MLASFLGKIKKESIMTLGKKSKTICLRTQQLKIWEAQKFEFEDPQGTLFLTALISDLWQQTNLATPLEGVLNLTA